MPDVRLLALPLLRDPGAEKQSPRQEQGGPDPPCTPKPTGNTAMSTATPGDWGWCPQMGPKLSRSHTWKNAVREQIKQAFGKTLEHTDWHQGRTQ